MCRLFLTQKNSSKKIFSRNCVKSELFSKKSKKGVDNIAYLCYNIRVARDKQHGLKENET